MSQYNYNELDTNDSAGADLRLAVLGLCLMGCILFAITLFIDIKAQKGLIPIPVWVSVGDVNDARVILGSIIGAVSTVLGLVFSVVLLVLSMAASQFGPRLLRRFIMDQNGQYTIGLFTVTFLFSLFTLVVVRSESGHEFVPQVTILTAVVLMIVSFGALITYSHSIRKGIQTGNLIAAVAYDLSKAIAGYIALRKARAETIFSAIEDSKALRKQCFDEGYPILALNAGYLQTIDYGTLIAAATVEEIVIALTVRPGNFIIKGTILATVYPPQKGLELCQSINKALRIGSNRTLTQDPEFALAQIVEIGMRALSPAINDTYTGIACVDWLSNDVLSLTDLPETGDAWQDNAGHIRLIEVPVQFPRLVTASFDMLRESGGSNPAILIRMLQNFTRMGPYFKSDDQRTAIMRQVQAIRELAELQTFTSTDLNDVINFYAKACDALEVTVKER